MTEGKKPYYTNGERSKGKTSFAIPLLFRRLVPHPFRGADKASFHSFGGGENPWYQAMVKRSGGQAPTTNPTHDHYPLLQHS